jgi:hypothetical protein
MNFEVIGKKLTDIHRLVSRKLSQSAIWASPLHIFYELLCSCYGHNYSDLSDQGSDSRGTNLELYVCLRPNMILRYISN